MPESTERDPRPLWIATLLISICAAACWIAFSRIQSTRHELVQRRLRTAVDIVRERAAAAIKSPDALPIFVEDMRRWANVTGLRITLIMPDGSVRHSAYFSITSEEWPSVKARLMAGLGS